MKRYRFLAAVLAFASTASANAQDLQVHQSGRDAEISIVQVGDASASVRQSGRAGSLRLEQTGPHHAELVQRGGGLTAVAIQGGTHRASLTLRQDGERGRVEVTQAATLAGNSATLLQIGRENLMVLDQLGGGNESALTQQGDHNSMTARQVGTGNSLNWQQIGNNLPDLKIEQTGAMAITIVQHGGG